MGDIDQRSDGEGRDVDDSAGARRGISIGRTAITGWALTAVFVLAGFGTALGATPGPVVLDPVADRTPAAAGVANPFGPFAVVPTMDTVTAPSVPTATVGTQGADATVVANPTAATDPTGTATASPQQATFTTGAPDDRARRAITTALAQIGLPYVWGGNGPTNGDAGFDCSGLTTFSYGTAGVRLPRTAHTQFNAGPLVPPGAPLQPGDLVFYGTTARVHHVGMYIGDGRMVNAPTFGKPVQVAFYRYRGDDYLAASRPAGSGALTTGPLPAFPLPLPVPAGPGLNVPLSPAQDPVFRAPIASLPAVLPQPGDPAPSEQESAAKAIAESDAVAANTVTAPSKAVQPVTAPSSSAPVGGTTTSSSAPVTTVPTTATGSATSTVATPTPTSATPAGTTTAATTTTVAPAPAVTTTTTTKAAGSTKATATLAPTSSKTATSKATSTPVKVVTTSSKAAPKTTEDDPTTSESTKEDEATTEEEKTSAEKVTTEKETKDEDTAEEKSDSDSDSSSSSDSDSDSSSDSDSDSSSDSGDS